MITDLEYMYNFIYNYNFNTIIIISIQTEYICFIGLLIVNYIAFFKRLHNYIY